MTEYPRRRRPLGRSRLEMRSIGLRHLVFVASTYAYPSILDTQLFARDAFTCPPSAQALNTCGNGIQFCCTEGTTCIPTVSDNSTVVCCPKGQSCDIIQPITCDISQQNATKLPDNVIHTSHLDGSMIQCGGACCPFGYACHDNLCGRINADLASPSSSIPPASTSAVTLSSSKPASTSSSPSTSSTPSSTSPSSSTQTPTSTASSSSSSQIGSSSGSSSSGGSTSTTSSSTSTAAAAASASPTPASSSSTSAGAIAGIVLGVIAGLALIAIIVLLLVQCRRRCRNSPRRSADFMGTTPCAMRFPDADIHSEKTTPTVISEPIEHSESHRTDFLLRRGSSITGFEQRNQPSWSNSFTVQAAVPRPPLARTDTEAHIMSGALSRTQSERDRDRDSGSHSPTPIDDETEEDESAPVLSPPARTFTEMEHRNSARLPPLFSKPLPVKPSGLPASPSPHAATSIFNPRIKPARTFNSTDSIPQFGTAQQIAVMPVREKACQREIRTGSPESRAARTMREMQAVSEEGEDVDVSPLSRQLSRASSGAIPRQLHKVDSSSTISSRSRASRAAALSRSSTQKSGVRRHSSSASTETINVMLPPPSIFQSPLPGERVPPARTQDDVRRETTFEQMMQRAGYNRTEWRT